MAIRLNSKTASELGEDFDQMRSFEIPELKRKFPSFSFTRICEQLVKLKAHKISFATWHSTFEMDAEQCAIFCDFVVSKFVCLKAVELKNSNQDTIATVCDALADNKTIRLVSLHPSGGNYTFKLAKAISNLLIKTRTLLRLDLGGCHVGNIALSNIFSEGITRNGTLKELNLFPDQLEQQLNAPSLDQHTARLICETLRTNYTIETFCFWYQRISVSASQVIFQFLKENNALKTLHMQGTEICGGLRWLCNSLKSNVGLKTLWIGDTFNIDDEETNFLCDCLNENENLKELTFEAGMLTDQSAPLFEKMVRTNRSLRKLYFNGCNKLASQNAWFPVIQALSENYFLLSFVCPLDYNPEYAHFSMSEVHKFLRRNAGLIRKSHELLRLGRLFYFAPSLMKSADTLRSVLFDLILENSLEASGLTSKQISNFFRFVSDRSTLGMSDSLIRFVFYGDDIFGSKNIVEEKQEKKFGEHTEKINEMKHENGKQEEREAILN